MRPWPYILLLLAALGTLAAYALGGPSRPFLHCALAQLCHGVSGGKIAFLLLFIAAVATSLAFAPANVNPATPPSRRLWFVVALGLAASMTSFLFYVIDLGLPMGVPTFHWRDGVNSVNSLTHIHTSKAPIALLLNAFGGDSLNAHFDTGAAYLAAVPTPLALFIGLCFIAACTIAIAESRSVVARFEPATRPLIALVYAVAAANACKSILDGGPLAYDCVASLLTLALLRGSPGLAGIGPWLKSAAKPVLLALALWVAILLMLQPGAIDRHPGLLLYRVALMGLPLAAGWAIVRRSEHQLQNIDVRHATAFLPRLLPAAACIGIGGCYVWDAAKTSLRPLGQTACDTARVFDQQWATLCEVPLPVGVTNSEAYSLAGDNPGRARRVSLRPQTDTASDGFYAELVVPPGRPWSLRPNLGDPGPITIPRCEPVDDTRWPWFRIKVESDGRRGPRACPPLDRPLTILDDHERFVAYHALDARLRRGGLNEYILIPYVFYRSDATAPESGSTARADVQNPVPE